MKQGSHETPIAVDAHTANMPCYDKVAETVEDDIDAVDSLLLPQEAYTLLCSSHADDAALQKCKWP